MHKSKCKTHLRKADEPASLSQPSPGPKTLETPSLLLNYQGKTPLFPDSSCTVFAPLKPLYRPLLGSCSSKLCPVSTSHLLSSHRLQALLQAHKISEVLMLTIYEGPAASCKSSRDNVVLCGQLGKAMSRSIPSNTLCLMSPLLS